MDDFKKEIIRERLQETLKNDTQETIARKLNVTQGNISKWLNGHITPTTDNLLLISQAYNVSVDWLLGISDEKKIDRVVLQKLSYEEILLIIDHLLNLGIVQIPEHIKTQNENNEYEEVEEITDYLKINDLILSKLLRLRVKYQDDRDIFEAWKKNHLSRLSESRLLRYTEKIDELLKKKNFATFTYADWASLIRDIEKMTDDEVLTELKKIEEERGKDGK